MATKLKKAVRRETSSKDMKGRTLIVSLEPNDFISFRPKGHKRTVRVYLGHCYKLAQLITAEIDYKQRLETYNERKGLQKGLRKPKRPTLPLSKMYFDAFK